MAEPVELYFSFRSPYSWLALERLARSRRLPLESCSLVPLYPVEGGNVEPPDPSRAPAKFRYLLQDVTRVARAYGLRPAWPPSVDTDWPLVHGAFLHARDAGAGPAFAVATARARFAGGRDVGDPAVVGELARGCGLDPDAALAFARDPATRERLEAGIRAAGEGGVFGVPTFRLGDELFWGNDRIEWLLRRLDEQRGTPVPRLDRDPFAPVVGVPGD